LFAQRAYLCFHPCECFIYETSLHSVFQLDFILKGIHKN
jgi:hypothetical protein